MRMLVLCTGNSARSQMAEGFLRQLGVEVASAGTEPAERVHPYAVEVMREVGIDLREHRPKSVEQFLEESFDVVLTVCGEADRKCPAFTGKVGRRVHIGFEDPARGTREDFRRVRDQIQEKMKEFIDERH
jgi:arsenate reductase